MPESAKRALRAASVFLTSAQRKQVTSFLQAPGNYNSQSGEITGILKNMNDTFTSNLATARDEEAKSLKSYSDYKQTAEAQYSDMRTAKLSKKSTIGNLASAISTTSSERNTKIRERTASQRFLDALTQRCETKKAEFDKRNMLRSNEEAAIAQAIAILNSDGAFEVFSNTDVKPGNLNQGPDFQAGYAEASFLQTSSVIHRKKTLTADRVLRAKVIKSLLATAKQTHSMRLAKTIASLAAVNPFEAVVKQIRDVMALIDKEKEADQNKKDWCDAEQSNHNAAKADQLADVGTLTGNIATLETAVDESKTNIAQANADSNSNREAQASETDARKTAHANFNANLKNLQDAQQILGKAIEVLTKYYDFLAKSTANPSYQRNTNKDSGGSNLEQIGGNPTVDDLTEACSNRPDCAGFNTAGWLKSAIAPSGEWYDWDGGDLYVKQLSFLQTEAPDKGPKMSKGGEGGNRAIKMLTFIKSETKDTADQAITDEKTSQMQYETNMQALSDAASGLSDSLATYRQDLATAEKRLTQASEDKATTEKELGATRHYLAEIEPGCTYIQSNIAARIAAQDAEKAALSGAITTLESSPAYNNYATAQESEDLGKCSDICNGSKDTMTAECQACINEVTVFGYCSQASNAAQVSGCDTATDTGSADEMNAPSK
jgi:chromosome segregation ATPase